MSLSDCIKWLKENTRVVFYHPETGKPVFVFGDLEPDEDLEDDLFSEYKDEDEDEF